MLPLYRKVRKSKRLANKTKCLLNKRTALPLSLFHIIEPKYIQQAKPPNI